MQSISPPTVAKHLVAHEGRESTSDGRAVAATSAVVAAVAAFEEVTMERTEIAPRTKTLQKVILMIMK